MINTVEKRDVLPVCPHCNNEVQTIWYRQIQSILGKRYIYFCSVCRKVLGLTHRKGFWMG